MPIHGSQSFQERSLDSAIVLSPHWRGHDPQSFHEYSIDYDVSAAALRGILRRMLLSQSFHESSIDLVFRNSSTSRHNGEGAIPKFSRVHRWF